MKLTCKYVDFSLGGRGGGGGCLNFSGYLNKLISILEIVTDCNAYPLFTYTCTYMNNGKYL